MALTRSLLLLLTWLPLLAHAITTFTPECTRPNNSSVNFVSSPNTRGTLDILWSSLFTIIACTWTVLHLNIPEQRNGRDQNLNGPWHRKIRTELKWTLKGLWPSFKWMSITIVAPECTLAVSLGQLIYSRALRKRIFNEFGRDVWCRWTLTHVLYASMGGFAVRKRPGHNTSPSMGTSSSPEIDEERNLSLLTELIPLRLRSVPENSVESTTFRFNAAYDSAERTSAELHNDPRSSETQQDISLRRHRNVTTGEQREDYALYHLHPKTVFRAIKIGLISPYPPISQEKINDKTKADAFGKIIALAQIFWYCIGVVVRGARGLAVSQLEIAVTAFAVCSAVIYAANFPKPKGIAIPTTLKDVGPEAFEKLVELQIRVISEDHDRILDGLLNLTNGVRIPNHSYYGSSRYLISGGVLFGAVHLAAWNFDFFTRVDRDLWRAAAIVSMTSLPFGALANVYQSEKRLLGLVVDFFGWFVVGTYTIARLILIVEMFRCLFYLPPDAYVATWTSSLPHIG